jgi:hypothetical protein
VYRIFQKKLKLLVRTNLRLVCGKPVARTQPRGAGLPPVDGLMG